MKILFIGDIFGQGGREAVTKLMPKIREEYKPSLVIANGENMTHGNGLTSGHVDEMVKAGVNFFTSGNHIWGNKDGVMSLSDSDFPVIRPANYPSDDTPGRGYAIVDDGMMNKVLIINLMGVVFMKEHLDHPFKVVDKILAETALENLNAIFVDFHAETTSEKYALGHHLDGRVSAVIGTHTHIPTADCHIMEGGTAFMADAGMVGARDSIIGVKKDIVVNKFINQMPAKLEPEIDGEFIFNAVLIEVDEKTKKAISIEHIIKTINL